MNHFLNTVYYCRITNAEAQQRNAEAWAKQEKEEAAARQFEQQVRTMLFLPTHFLLS